jgi:Lon protease-like protein
MKKLALFPLNLVAFPGETLNLHVFEPRYKQLIGECLDSGETFGIPAYINNAVDYGTEMSIEKLVKLYEDGRMDISTKAHRVFRVKTFMAQQSHKLYPSGMISLQEDYSYELPDTQDEFFQTLEELFSVMDLNEQVMIHRGISAFEIGHKIGLTLNQEYELLTLRSEKERQVFILGHLRVALPILKQMAKAREVVKMNGHFKFFNPLDLK